MRRTSGGGRENGFAEVAGTDITSLDEDRLARLRGQKIGFVFQFFHLVPSLTAHENVMVPMEIAGRSDARATGNARRSRKGVGTQRLGPNTAYRSSVRIGLKIEVRER